MFYRIVAVVSLFLLTLVSLSFVGYTYVVYNSIEQVVDGNFTKDIKLVIRNVAELYIMKAEILRETRKANHESKRSVKKNSFLGVEIMPALKTNCPVESWIIRCERIDKQNCPTLFEVYRKYPGSTRWRSVRKICASSCMPVGRVPATGFFTQLTGYRASYIALPMILSHHGCTIEAVNTTMGPLCDRAGSNTYCKVFYKYVDGYSYISHDFPDTPIWRDDNGEKKIILKANYFREIVSANKEAVVRLRKRSMNAWQDGDKDYEDSPIIEFRNRTTCGYPNRDPQPRMQQVEKIYVTHMKTMVVPITVNKVNTLVKSVQVTRNVDVPKTVKVFATRTIDNTVLKTVILENTVVKTKEVANTVMRTLDQITVERTLGVETVFLAETVYNTQFVDRTPDANTVTKVLTLAPETVVVTANNDVTVVVPSKVMQTVTIPYTLHVTITPLQANGRRKREIKNTERVHQEDDPEFDETRDEMPGKFEDEEEIFTTRHDALSAGDKRNNEIRERDEDYRLHRRAIEDDDETRADVHVEIAAKISRLRRNAAAKGDFQTYLKLYYKNPVGYHLPTAADCIRIYARGKDRCHYNTGGRTIDASGLCCTIFDNSVSVTSFMAESENWGWLYCGNKIDELCHANFDNEGAAAMGAAFAKFISRMGFATIVQETLAKFVTVFKKLKEINAASSTNRDSIDENTNIMNLINTRLTTHENLVYTNIDTLRDNIILNKAEITAMLTHLNGQTDINQDLEDRTLINRDLVERNKIKIAVISNKIRQFVDWFGILCQFSHQKCGKLVNETVTFHSTLSGFQDSLHERITNSTSDLHGILNSTMTGFQGNINDSRTEDKEIRMKLDQQRNASAEFRRLEKNRTDGIMDELKKTMKQKEQTAKLSDMKFRGETESEFKKGKDGRLGGGVGVAVAGTIGGVAGGGGLFILIIVLCCCFIKRDNGNNNSI